MGVIAGLASGVAVGRLRGVASKKSALPDMDRLYERMVHARNMGMRLQELGLRQRDLRTTQDNNRHLEELRREVEWMLDLVQSRLLAASSPRDWEDLETLLGAVSKSLRHMLEVGQFPEMALEDFLPAEEQIRGTLSSITHLPNSDLSRDLNKYQITENEVNKIIQINLLIQQYRAAYDRQFADKGIA
ncbi:MAG: hypothetical protein ACPG66_09295 [Flavobacteriales bacterium]